MADTEETRFHSKELILQRTYGGAVGRNGTPCPLLGHLSHGGTQGVTRVLKPATAYDVTVDPPRLRRNHSRSAEIDHKHTHR